MLSPDQISSYFIDIVGRVNKIEERAMAEGLGSAVSITEIHIIEKIGDLQPIRMSEVAKSIGVTLATLTVACDKLEAKELVRRTRDQNDRRVVNVTLTPRGHAAHEYHKRFHERMVTSIMDTLTPEQACVLGQSLQKLNDFFRAQDTAAK